MSGKENCMQFTINTRAFLQALQGVNIRYRMHDSVLLEARKGKITVCAATKARFLNDDNGPHLQATCMLIPTSLEREGTYAVHYRQLVHALRAFTVTVEVRQEGPALMISENHGPHLHQTPIKGEPPDMFPRHAFGARPEGTTYTKEKVERVQCHACKEWHSDRVTETYQVMQVLTQRVRVKQEVLLAMVKQVIWVTDDENCLRPAHAGIGVSVLDNVLSLRATDGWCVSIRSEQPGKTENWSQGILVPAKLFAQAVRLFPKQAEILMETVLEQHQFVKGTDEEKKDQEAFVQAVAVRLSTDDIQVILSPMNAPLPRYCSAFPADCKTRVVCEVTDLLNAVKAVSPVEPDASPAIWLHIQEIGIRVEVRREELSASAIHEIAVAQKMGQDISLLLSCWYLIEMLRVSTSPQVVLECTEPDKPVVLRSCGDRESYLCALMPMGPSHR
jgi:DNA polymerase III sliding clamp (beta) subunit (PCNA family)